jgi:hypothetical protein
MTGLSAGTNMCVVILSCEVFSLIFVNSLGRLRHITFVSSNHYRSICLQVFPQLKRPLLHFSPRVLISDIIHNNGTSRASVVNRIKGVVSLLSSSVPYC